MTGDERYGVSADDPQVTRAVEALSENADEVLRTRYCAVFAFARDNDPEILTRFARDAMTTARLHAAPNHDQNRAMDGARNTPVGAGKDVREVFASLRR